MLSTARPPAKLAVWHTPQALTIHARQKQEKDFGAALIALENEDHCRRVAIRTAANLMSQNRLRVKHKDNVAQGEKSMKARLAQSMQQELARSAALSEALSRDRRQQAIERLRSRTRRTPTLPHSGHGHAEQHEAEHWGDNSTRASLSTNISPAARLSTTVPLDYLSTVSSNPMMVSPSQQMTSVATKASLSDGVALVPPPIIVPKQPSPEEAFFSPPPTNSSAGTRTTSPFPRGDSPVRFQGLENDGRRTPLHEVEQDEPESDDEEDEGDGTNSKRYIYVDSPHTGNSYTFVRIPEGEIDMNATPPSLSQPLMRPVSAAQFSLVDGVNGTPYSVPTSRGNSAGRTRGSRPSTAGTARSGGSSRPKSPKSQRGVAYKQLQQSGRCAATPFAMSTSASRSMSVIGPISTMPPPPPWIGPLSSRPGSAPPRAKKKKDKQAGYTASGEVRRTNYMRPASASVLRGARESHGEKEGQERDLEDLAALMNDQGIRELLQARARMSVGVSPTASRTTNEPQHRGRLGGL